MEQQVKQRIAHIVRQAVVEEYGLKTCVATIKVLQKVLMLWGVDLSPHVVSLKVVPRESIELLSDATLSLEEKRRRGSLLPQGMRPVEILSTQEEMKFHVVGRTQIDGEHTLWDPSIDQVNDEVCSCHFGPLVFPISNGTTDSDGNINFLVDGCIVAYKEAQELEEKVYSLDVWRDSYSDLVSAIMKECFEQMQ